MVGSTRALTSIQKVPEDNQTGTQGGIDNVAIINLYTVPTGRRARIVSAVGEITIAGNGGIAFTMAGVRVTAFSGALAGSISIEKEFVLEAGQSVGIISNGASPCTAIFIISKLELPS